MNAPLSYTQRARRRSRRKCRWSAVELAILTREWGEVSERVLMRKIPGRTWDGIKKKAVRIGLASPSQGLVSIEEASRITGVHYRQLRAILTAESVQVTEMVRMYGSGKGHYRWHRVRPDEAMAAVVAHDNRRASRLTCAEAAARCGTDRVTMRRAIRALAAVRPVEGLRDGAPWSIAPEDADEAMAMRRAWARGRRAEVMRATVARVRTARTMAGVA